MVNRLNRSKLEQTQSLADAVKSLFGVNVEGRTCLFHHEAMTGDQAKSYYTIGLQARQDTYKNIARDFRTRTECYSVRHCSTYPSVGTIVDVGCGPGLLSIELAKETNGDILGIDLSQDMIHLANETLAKHPYLKDRVRFKQGNVYDLQNLVKDEPDINYVACRNALHRFNNPDLAIAQMYYILNPDGRLYLRDLRRDAHWKTILARIGEPRWKNPAIVKDYIGAMAQMFTPEEVKRMLDKIGIAEYTLTKGDYSKDELKSSSSEHLQEYAAEVEYVSIIKKT